MTNYRRDRTIGGTWFFTVNLANRKSDLLVRHIDLLRESFRHVRQKHPFTIDAIAVMPEHLHCIWTLPDDDHDFSRRWRLIKTRFSHQLPYQDDELFTQSRESKAERGIWQRRFWEHRIRDEADFKAHVDYIHFNPVKHGWVISEADWPYSSLHRNYNKSRRMG
ncbi:MAG: transposase [Fluviicoccus sp.]|uniref:REP-associated tyrosine transposase n=1 Tax=Fluviicoccus sp. TaxID=2003552 RepID=UPI00271C680F|nr:transposase [Fluviicoccus sp.]MDO8329473.1 transposase [Fluviicoccus sp.]